MDWDKVRSTPSAQAIPRLDLVESCWSFQSPSSQRVISCGIYRTDAGLELRAGYSIDDVVRTDRATSVDAARALAAEWRAALLDKGFVEITAEKGPM
jgi:hypothetical protein